MQRNIVAAAIVWMIAGSAFAQSNVTVYGIADVAYAYGRGDNGLVGANSGKIRFSGIQNGGWLPSRIGFKGEESLGNALKAVFLLEYGTSVDTNSALNMTRQSYVGLSSAYGSVTLGRQYAPSFFIMGRNSANEMSNINPLNTFVTSNPTMNNANGSRWDNSIAFQSKSFSGLSVRAIYAFGETNPASYNASTTDNGKLGLGVSYINGPFNIDTAYQNSQNVRTVFPSTATALYNAEGKDIHEWYIGGGYDLGFVRGVASYQKTKNKSDVRSTMVGGTAINTDISLWSVGAIVPVSAAGKVRVEYARIRFGQDNEASAARQDGTSDGWGLGYTHELSKRTHLYSYISRIDNDQKSRALGWIAGVGAKGESNVGFIAGIRHLF